jgi:septal ring factor EnvC (AmiA/AmiB activator)
MDERRCGLMSAIPRNKIAPLFVAVLLAASSLGCGSTPPCDIDISAVDAARSKAQAVEQELVDAQNEKARLEQQLAEEEARRRELEARKAQLEAQLKDLEG